MHSNGIVDSALSAQRHASLPWTPCCSSKLRLNRRNLSARQWRSLQGGILSNCRRTTIFTPNQVLTSCFTKLFCYCSWKEWHTICMQCSPKKRSPSLHPSIHIISFNLRLILIWVNGSSVTAVIRRETGTHPGQVTSPSLDTCHLLTQEQFRVSTQYRVTVYGLGEGN